MRTMKQDRIQAVCSNFGSMMFNTFHCGIPIAKQNSSKNDCCGVSFCSPKARVNLNAQHRLFESFSCVVIAFSAITLFLGYVVLLPVYSVLSPFQFYQDMAAGTVASILNTAEVRSTSVGSTYFFWIFFNFLCSIMIIGIQCCNPQEVKKQYKSNKGKVLMMSNLHTSIINEQLIETYMNKLYENDKLQVSKVNIAYDLEEFSRLTEKLKYNLFEYQVQVTRERLEGARPFRAKYRSCITCMPSDNLLGCVPKGQFCRYHADPMYEHHKKGFYLKQMLDPLYGVKRGTGVAFVVCNDKNDAAKMLKWWNIRKQSNEFLDGESVELSVAPYVQ